GAPPRAQAVGGLQGPLSVRGGGWLLLWRAGELRRFPWWRRLSPGRRWSRRRRSPVIRFHFYKSNLQYGERNYAHYEADTQNICQTQAHLDGCASRFCAADAGLRSIEFRSEIGTKDLLVSRRSE